MIAISPGVSAPTTEAEIRAWARAEGIRWTGAEMSRQIDDARRAAESIRGRAASEMGEFLDAKAGMLGRPLGENATVNWALAYLQSPGLPTTLGDGQAMMRAYINAQGEELGIPPEYIAAAKFIQEFPDTVEEGERWVVEISASYAAYYGVPLGEAAEGQILKASVYGALAYAGVPYSIVDVSVGALSDGNLSYEEVGAIATTIGAYVGGVIGQAYGLPYPIGAFIGSVVVGSVMYGLGAAFGFGGPSWRDQYNAQDAQLRAAARAATERNTEVALALWHEYNYYWDDLERSLQIVIDANSHPWLTTSTMGSPGIRYFRTTDITRIEGQRLPEPISKVCTQLFGCPYFQPQTFPVPRRVDAWQRTDTCCPYDPYAMPTTQSLGADFGAMVNGKVSAKAALAFWGARRYVTPLSVDLDIIGLTPATGGERVLGHAMASKISDSFEMGPGTEGPTFNQSHYVGGGYHARQHTDEAYMRESIAFVSMRGEKLHDSQVAPWATQLFKSSFQALPAAALVQRDITATIAARVAETQVAAQLEQEGKRETAVKAAAYRKELVRLRRQGERNTSVLNNTLLVAGAGALGGWAASALIK